MARVYQVPHHAFGWLVAGTALAALPHLLHGPFWLQALLPLAVTGRLLMQRGRLSVPGRGLRVLLLGGVLLGTLYSHGTVLGPEAGTCLLVGAFALKLLEMVRLRDAYVLLVLGYFVLATSFLFYQGPLAAAYSLLVLLCLTAALPGINRPEAGLRSAVHGRLAAVMLLQALPLMILLFVLVPRVGPLWSLEFNQQRARTGMSDSMAPGEVSNLSQSTELAFRAEFHGAVPPPAQRYWRGLTYSWFDGRRWSQARPRDLPQRDYVWFAERAGTPPDWAVDLLAAREQGPELAYRYRVLQEPSRRNWLYTLAVPFADDRSLGLVRDMRLVSQQELEQRFAYSVTSYPGLAGQIPLADGERAFMLQLPEGFNPRAHTMARQWRDQAASPQAYAQRLLNWFREEPFYYTLQPALLGEHSVDEFLFDSRRGFCEHYASAFVFMMRAAGVPARVVAGYQGGDLNPLGNHLSVHQYHAHAWAEIWLEGHGWVEVDPTAAVAPARIEQGLEMALEASDFSLLRRAGDRVPGLRQLRQRLDYLQFAWQKWVLSYDQTQQMSLLQRWFGRASLMTTGLLLALGAVLIVLVLALWVLLRHRAPGRTALQREYRAMLRLLRRRGVAVSEALPPRKLAGQVRQQWPAAAALVEQWARLYEHSAYAKAPGGANVTGDTKAPGIRRPKRALRQLRRRLRWVRGPGAARTVQDAS